MTTSQAGSRVRSTYGRGWPEAHPRILRARPPGKRYPSEHAVPHRAAAKVHKGAIRGLATELVLTLDDGMPVACAANFDHVGLAQRTRIGALISELRAARWAEARAALLVACGFESV